MIINLTKNRHSYSCLICGGKNVDELKELSIERKYHTKGNVVGFTVCNDCLKEMGEDLKEVL